MLRVENSSDLFHNGVSRGEIEVHTDEESLRVVRPSANGLAVEISRKEETSRYTFSPSHSLTTKKEPEFLPDILTYIFPKSMLSEASRLSFLLPPSGGNLMEVVARLPRLKSNLAQLFHGYGLKMMFDSGSQEIKAVKENGLDMYLISFNSLADSLQRLIFYKAAIESNHRKVLCFEEPEAHTFPPSITNVVNDIITSLDNQFFITTHGPYVVSSLLESVTEDLAIYVVDMAEGLTTVTRLSEEQLQEAYDNGIDMFYNIERYFLK